MTGQDPYNLQRFLREQELDYETALLELKRGRKLSHWIWYIFPQISGLGTSSMSIDFAIRSLKEAQAYLQHPILGKRLLICTQTLLEHKQKNIREILDPPDDLKVQSSMTLFDAVPESSPLFHQVIHHFFAGRRCDRTIAVLISD